MKILACSLVLSAAAFGQATRPPGNPVNTQTNQTITTAFLYNNKVSYQGAWSSIRTYNTQDLVTFGGASYISIAAPNLNQSPSASPAWWVALPGGTGGSSGIPGGNPGQLQWNSAGLFAGLTVGGDGTLNTSTGILTVTRTNNVPFAASATSDTTNAANITSGTLAPSHLPLPASATLGGVNSKDCSLTGQFVQKINVDGSITCATAASGGVPGGSTGQLQWNSAGVFAGVTVAGDGTLNTTTGALIVTKTNGTVFATSATVDATNAANISAGTLAAARLPTPAASTLGGVESKSCTGGNLIQSINIDGTETCGAAGLTLPVTVSGATSGGIPCFPSAVVLNTSTVIANGEIVTGAGAGGCAGGSGVLIGNVAQLSPGSSVNLFASNVTNKTQTGGTNPGLVAACEALPSTPQAGQIDNDSSCNHYTFDGTNTRYYVYLKASGFATPTPPTTGHFITWGPTYSLQDGGAPTYATLTDGATVTWDLMSQVAASAALTFTVHSGSRTLNIANPLNGGQYTMWIKQDGTGGEGLTLGTGCTWKVSGGGSGAVTPSTAASAVDVLTFTYDGTNCYANFNKNFT